MNRLRTIKRIFRSRIHLVWVQFVILLIAGPVDLYAQGEAGTVFSECHQKPARRLQYYPDGRDIVCVNGENRYSRALYGGPTLFRLETSDRPVFATYNNDKSKNFRFYLTCGGETVQLDSTDYCEAR